MITLPEYPERSITQENVERSRSRIAQLLEDIAGWYGTTPATEHERAYVCETRDVISKERRWLNEARRLLNI